MRLILFLAAFCVWIISFYIGQSVNSVRIAELDLQPLVAEALTLMSKTWPNLAVLCSAAGLLGGMIRDDASTRGLQVTTAIGAGFLVFVTMASTQFGITGTLQGVLPRDVAELPSVQSELEEDDFKLRDQLLYDRYLHLAILGTGLAVGASTVGTVRKGTFPFMPK